jgi:hypothetical protein
MLNRPRDIHHAFVFLFNELQPLLTGIKARSCGICQASGVQLSFCGWTRILKLGSGIQSFADSDFGFGQL